MPFPKFRGHLLAVLTLALLVPLPAQTPAPKTRPFPTDRTPPEGVVVLHDVVIGKGGNRDLHAEIAYPKDAPIPLPAVIYIHGGGWKEGSQKQAPIFDLAQAGFFAASIEYRLSPEAKWPAQIQDCKLGVRWLRANAAHYHVDPKHIGVWGSSAGGHLVACLGTMGDVKEYEGTGGYPGVSSAVQAVADFFGPTDLTRQGVYSPEATQTIGQLLGAPREQNPGLWKSASPLAYVKAGDPPMLIVHGDADMLVPMAQSIDLDKALTKAGVPHQLLIVKNGGHGFKPLPGKTIDPSKDDIQKAVDAFFAKYLKKS